MNFSIQPKIFAAIVVAAAALLTLGGQYFWNNYRYAPANGLVADTTSVLEFVLEDSYQIGQEIPVKISNSASSSYTAFLPEEFCNFELYDSSGKIILQDYGDEVKNYTVVPISPDTITELCVLKLSECAQRSRTHCLRTESLRAGAYTVLGKFSGPKGSETTIKKEFRIVP